MSLGPFEPVVGLRGRDGLRIGEERIRLLAAIDSHGSIAAAARAVGITYKSAWDGIAAINNLADRPLVVSHVGGRAGGGAALSDEGRHFLRAMLILQSELSRVARLIDAPPDEASVSPLSSWRFLMKTSARNMLQCKVAEVKAGAVNAEIILDVADGMRLVAIITAESARTLGLVPGREAFALIKSTFVLLALEGQIGRTSARNVLAGTVARRDDGPVSSEIVLDIGSGKTIAAIITRESADALGMKVGDRASALIKASHIILAVE